MKNETERDSTSKKASDAPVTAAPSDSDAPTTAAPSASDAPATAAPSTSDAPATAAPSDANAPATAPVSAAAKSVRSTRIRTLLRFIVFFVILDILLAAISLVVLPKTNIPQHGIHGSLAWNFYGEPEDSIDVVFIGDSDAYNSIIPLQLYHDYGFTSVVCGQASQHMLQAYNLLDEVLQMQDPKVVVLETDSLFTWEVWPKLVDNNIKLFLSYNYPVFEYHDRWKDLSPDDFAEMPDYTWKMGTKGYNLDTKVKSYDGGDYMGTSDAVAFIDPVARYYLNAIVDLCDQKGATLVLYDAPSATSWNMSKHNAVQRFADENGLVFIDMNLSDFDPGIDWSQDTYDGGMHMNVYGATKVTSSIGTYLSHTFALPDHRSDSNYTDEWDAALKAYASKLPDDLKDTVK